MNWPPVLCHGPLLSWEPRGVRRQCIAAQSDREAARDRHADWQDPNVKLIGCVDDARLGGIQLNALALRPAQLVLDLLEVAPVARRPAVLAADREVGHAILLLPHVHHVQVIHPRRRCEHLVVQGPRLLLRQPAPRHLGRVRGPLRRHGAGGAERAHERTSCVPSHGTRCSMPVQKNAYDILPRRLTPKSPVSRIAFLMLRMRSANSLRATLSGRFSTRCSCKGWSPPLSYSVWITTVTIFRYQSIIPMYSLTYLSAVVVLLNSPTLQSPAVRQNCPLPPRGAPVGSSRSHLPAGRSAAQAIARAAPVGRSGEGRVRSKRAAECSAATASPKMSCVFSCRRLLRKRDALAVCPLEDDGVARGGD